VTEKKTAKKAKKKSKAAPKPKLRILAQVEQTPEVLEILKSNEAKLYLTGIDRAMAKLRAMIDRELKLRHHPGHPGHAKT